MPMATIQNRAGVKTIQVSGSFGEKLPYAEETTFGGDEVAEEYAIRGETLNAIAARTQAMAGTTKAMSPSEIIYWLGRVLYIPQGYATMGHHMEPIAYSSNATGIVLIVYPGGASSNMVLDTMTFGSAASGVLEE